MILRTVSLLVLLNCFDLEHSIYKTKQLSRVLKSVHFKKSVTRSSFLSKRVVIFAEIKTKTAKMTTLFERNEDRVTDFLK